MLFDIAPEATAVLTMADSQAIAVLEEARRRNISIPDDLSITGFDDIVEAARSDPPLTTIAQNPLEKACGGTYPFRGRTAATRRPAGEARRPRIDRSTAALIPL